MSRILSEIKFHNGRFRYMSNKAVILCGGVASRLGGLAEDIPKSLFPIGPNGETALHYHLSNIESFIDDVYLSIGHLSEKYIEWIEENEGNYDVNIRPIIENRRLGTGGATLKALLMMPHHDRCGVLVINGDVVTNIPIDRFWEIDDLGADLTILGVRLADDVHDYGTINFDDETYFVEGFYEKEETQNDSEFINAGFYLFHEAQKAILYMASIMARRDFNDLSIEKHVFEAGDMRIAVDPYELDSFMNEYWFDIGTPERLERTKNYLNE